MPTISSQPRLDRIPAFLCGAIAVLALSIAVFYPDTKFVRNIDKKEWTETGDSTWVWPLDRDARSIPRFAYPDSTSSVVFLDDRLIPLRTTHASWPTTERPWHEIVGQELILHLDRGRSKSMDDASVQLTLLAAYSNVRIAAAVVGTTCLWMSSWLWPIAFVGSVCSFLRRVRWLSCFGGIAAILVWFAMRQSWIFPLPVHDALLVNDEPFPWYAPGIWCLRRLESSGPGTCFVFGIGVYLALTRAKRSMLRGKIDRLRRLLQRRLIGEGVFLACLCLSATVMVGAGLGSGIRHPPDLTHYSAPFQGRVNWTDAAEYVHGAQAMLARGKLTSWNQRRPLNATLFSVRYGLVGADRNASKLIEHFFLAVGIGFLIAVVSLRIGPASALATLGWTWGFGRWFTASTLSEPLGLTLGCWGTGLLLLASDATRFNSRSSEIGQGSKLGNRKNLIANSSRSLFSLYVCLGVMTIAQTARPGALLALPLFGAAIALRCVPIISWRDAIRSWKAWKALGTCAAIVALGLLTPAMLNSLYGDSQNQPGANLAHTLAGLSEGRSWSECVAAHQADLQSIQTEGEVANYLYALAWRNFRAHPEVAMGQFAKGWSYFFREFPRTLSQTVFPEIGQHKLVKATMLIVACMALTAWFRLRHCEVFTYFMAIGVGTLCSVAIVFLDGSWRCLAATWPMLAVLMSMGLNRNPSLCRTQMHGSTWSAIKLASQPGVQRWVLPGYHAAGLSAVLGLAFVGPCVMHQWYREASTISTVKQVHIHTVPKVGESFTAQIDERFREPTIDVGWDRPGQMSWRQFQLGLQESDIDFLPQFLAVFEEQHPFSLRHFHDIQHDRLWWLIEQPSNEHENESKRNVARRMGKFLRLVEPNLIERIDR